MRYDRVIQSIVVSSTLRLKGKNKDSLPQKRSCVVTSSLETALLVKSAVSSIPRRESILLPYLLNISSIGMRFCHKYSLTLTSKELGRRCHGDRHRGSKDRSSLTKTHLRQPHSCSLPLTVPLLNRCQRLGNSTDERNTHVDISFGQGVRVRPEHNVDCKPIRIWHCGRSNLSSLVTMRRLHCLLRVFGRRNMHHHSKLMHTEKKVEPSVVAF